LKELIESEIEVARRTLLLGLGGAVVALSASEGVAAPVDASVTRRTLGGRSISIVDLTNKLTRDFYPPTTPTRLAMRPIDGSGVKVGMLLNELTLNEHTGTHIDVPRHFGKEGKSLGEVPLHDLIVPLAVIDMRAKAAANQNVAVEPQDILAWERRHGRLPKDCCVAMRVDQAPFSRRPAAGSRGSPGFGPEAADFLMKERQVNAIAVEGGSIDIGTNGPAYPVHQSWLRSGRWALEFVTNLDKVPPSGALMIVGAAPIEDATGMPVRVMAMF
jgi:kynurenine formamidase